MKKVLFVIEALHRGGAERAISNLTTHFPEDWNIDILLDDESLIGYPYKGNILSLSRPEKKSAVYFVGNVIRRTIYLRKIKKNKDYEACISFLDSANISNVLSGNKYCKTIVSIRTDVMAEENELCAKIIFLPLTRCLFKYADNIVAVSKEIEKKLVEQLKMPEKKIRTITNGYDYKLIRKGMEKGVFGKEGNAAKEKIVVTIGRVVNQKGQWHLVRAFSDVLKKEPNAKLYILGDGILKEYLQKLINLFDLKEKIILAGYSDNPYGYLANADVFVLPSLFEGYPNALAEAVCCGVPCIATDVHSGAREILAPDLDAEGERVNDVLETEYGILIPVCSGRKYQDHEPLEYAEQKMAEAMIRLLGDSKKREKYRQKSLERREDLNIFDKVQEWINVILE